MGMDRGGCKHTGRQRKQTNKQANKHAGRQAFVWRWLDLDVGQVCM